MKIFSLNGNLFGPRTAYGEPGSLQAAHNAKGGPFNILLEFVKINTEICFLRSGETISLNDMCNFDIFITNIEEISFKEIMEIESVFGDRFIPRTEISFIDTYDGGALTTVNLATNFPFLMNDYFNSRIFRTADLSAVKNFESLTHKTYATEKNQTLMCFENVFFNGYSNPLCTRGGPIEQGAEFYQSVSLYQDETAISDSIESPILYLNFPGSYNYNIFVHEHLPAALIYDNLPKNTRIMINGDKYKIEFLVNLGIKEDMIYCNKDNPVLLKKVYIPMRKLNLKSVDTTLLRAYNVLKTNLRVHSPASSKVDKKLYLGRRSVSNNSGVNRFIINQSDVNNCLLNEFGFDVVYSEDLNLSEKYYSLSNCEILISPIGANLVNVALCENVKKIILICSPVWWHFKKYWMSLLHELHPSAEILLFEACSVHDNHESHDPFNKPFDVDVDALRNVIGSL